MVGESGPERRSAVEQSPLEEFLATAELAGTRFVAGEGLGSPGGGRGGERGWARGGPWGPEPEKGQKGREWRRRAAGSG